MSDPRPAPRGIQKLSFNDVELDWFKMPWLDVADRDRPFVKRSTIDLDPVGGVNTTVEITLGGLDRQYIRIDQIEIVPADPFSVQNTEILQRIGDSPLNHWRMFDNTVSPGDQWEAEFAVNRLFTIPPGINFVLRFTNLSAFGRVRFDTEIRGNLSRVVN